MEVLVAGYGFLRQQIRTVSPSSNSEMICTRERSHLQNLILDISTRFLHPPHPIKIKNSSEFPSSKDLL